MVSMIKNVHIFTFISIAEDLTTSVFGTGYKLQLQEFLCDKKKGKYKARMPM